MRVFYSNYTLQSVAVFVQVSFSDHNVMLFWHLNSLLELWHCWVQHQFILSHQLSSQLIYFWNFGFWIRTRVWYIWLNQNMCTYIYIMCIYLFFSGINAMNVIHRKILTQIMINQLLTLTKMTKLWWTRTLSSTDAATPLCTSPGKPAKYHTYLNYIQKDELQRI